MATNHLQDGNTLDYLNSGTEKIISGTPVPVGDVVGVAHGDIAPDSIGVLHMTGVFVLPKAAEAITQGQKVYFSDGKVTAIGEAAPKAAKAAGGYPVAGTAWESAESGASTVPVRLGF